MVPPDQSDQLKAAGIVIDSVSCCQLRSTLTSTGSRARSPDRRVREAIFRGINRQRIVDVVFKGTAALYQRCPYRPAVYHSLENPDFAKNFPAVAAKYKLPIYSYDVAAANKLLDDAGWVKGSDGIREKNGEKLSFIFGSTVNSTRQRIQALVQADLKGLGIDAQTKAYPSGAFFSGLNDGIIAQGICKLCMFAWIQASTNDLSNWDQTQIPTPAQPNLGNRQRYVNQAATAANQLYDVRWILGDCRGFGSRPGCHHAGYS